MSEEGKYPEHDKLRPVVEYSNVLGNFLEWAQSEKGLVLCRMTETERYRDEYMPSMERIEDLLAQFYGIDLKKLDDEKRAMLEELREAHERSTG